MVMSWLINSMTNEIGLDFLYYATAKEIWDAVKETYSDNENTSQLIEIKGLIHDLRQGDLTVTQYFNTLNRYWQQLDIFEDANIGCSACNLKYKQNCDKERSFKFLLGLHKNLDEIRGRLLAVKPLPSIREAFSEVRSEASRRKVMLGNSKVTQPSIDSSALVSQRIRDNRARRGERPWCDHYKNQDTQKINVGRSMGSHLNRNRERTVATLRAATIP